MVLQNLPYHQEPLEDTVIENASEEYFFSVVALNRFHVLAEKSVSAWLSHRELFSKTLPNNYLSTKIKHLKNQTV